ncbi:MAG: hypothetical protein K8R87_09060 [Verrucomicrobia bacterium]|nr:hypothetical protein [Verrucomicrobiota bacterium]
MKRILRSAVRCLSLIALLQITGIICSWVAFNIAFRILDTSGDNLPFDFTWVWMSFGLCLLAFLVRGIFVALPISILLLLRPSRLTPLITFMVAGVVFWILGAGIYSIQQGHWEMDNPRDRSLAIGGALGYAIATFITQQLISLRKPIGDATVA